MARTKSGPQQGQSTEVMEIKHNQKNGKRFKRSRWSGQRKHIINAFEELINPKFDWRKIIRWRKNRLRQSIPQLSCVRKEARTISIYVRMNLLNTVIMRWLSQSFITTPGSRTGKTVSQLLRAVIKIFVREKQAIVFNVFPLDGTLKFEFFNFTIF